MYEAYIIEYQTCFLSLSLYIYIYIHIIYVYILVITQLKERGNECSKSSYENKRWRKKRKTKKEIVGYRLRMKINIWIMRDTGVCVGDVEYRDKWWRSRTSLVDSKYLEVEVDEWELDTMDLFVFYKFRNWNVIFDAVKQTDFVCSFFIFQYYYRCIKVYKINYFLCSILWHS